MTSYLRTISLAASAVLALIPPAWAGERPIVIKFSHVVADDTPKGKAAIRFKELAEARTHGKVRVDVYPNSTLYKDREEMEALQLGAVQMLAPSLSKFSPLGLTEFEVFDLPFLFESHRDLRRVVDGPAGKNLLRKLESKGIIGLAYWDNGFKVMSANRPLRNPADFRNLRMRIQASNVLDAQMRALGAIPKATPFSDVYNALRADIVDGTENPPSNLYTQNMHEVQKYVTVSNHGYLGYAVIVNKRFWEDLPRDIRRTLEGAMEDATQYANEIARLENDTALEAVRRSGKVEVYTLTEQERRTWKRVLLDVHRTQAPRIGRQVIEEFYHAAGFDPGTL